jgi:hypothetical protein
MNLPMTGIEIHAMIFCSQQIVPLKFFIGRIQLLILLIENAYIAK